MHRKLQQELDNLRRKQAKFSSLLEFLPPLEQGLMNSSTQQMLPASNEVSSALWQLAHCNKSKQITRYLFAEWQLDGKAKLISLSDQRFSAQAS